MKTTIAIIVALCFPAAVTASATEDPVITQEMADYINSVQSSWTASLDQPFAQKTRSEAKTLAGALKTPSSLPRKTYPSWMVRGVPENYDARTAYPHCPTIKQIRDQSNCGSCWAFGAVEAMSDRYCILQQKNITLSALNLMTCCDSCLSDNDPCDGGDSDPAWWHWVNTGIVTEECQPYPFPRCTALMTNRAIYESCPPPQTAPACSTTCNNTLVYNHVLHKGQTAYSLSGEHDMMVEIFKYGPIEAYMDVYADFYGYYSGIYRHMTGPYLGGHYVKILGFGVEKGQKYWLAANSWDIYWGERGFFKIARGTDECSIEDACSAGIPLY